MMGTTESATPVVAPAGDGTARLPEHSASPHVVPGPVVTHKRRRVLIIAAVVVAVAACAIWIISSLGTFPPTMRM